MIRRLPTWSLLLIGGVSVSLAVFTVVEVVVDHEATVSLVEVASSVVVAVVGVSLVVKARVRGRSRVRGSRSSGWSGGVGGLRVSRGGTMRHRLHACTSVDRLVDYLLERAVEELPEGFRARFAEEWGDHRQHYSGWRLVWWALCVRATALRTVAALGPARLPGPGES